MAIFAYRIDIQSPLCSVLNLIMILKKYSLSYPLSHIFKLAYAPPACNGKGSMLLMTLRTSSTALCNVIAVFSSECVSLISSPNAQVPLKLQHYVIESVALSESWC